MHPTRAYIVLGLVVTTGHITPFAADQTPPVPAPDVVVAFRKAAETAEVHGVGVSEPAVSRIGREHLIDGAGLVVKLRDRKGSAGTLWETAPKQLRDLSTDNRAVAELGDRPRSGEAVLLREYLLRHLNDTLSRPDFYSEEAFKGIVLDKDVKTLLALGPKRTSLQNARLNWALLQSTFPGCLADAPSNLRTVRVRVEAGRDVVLILSSYWEASWHIEVQPGGRVVGVVLCGYHAQELMGIDAPVIYRAAHLPNGTPRTDGVPYLKAYDLKDEAFPTFAYRVKELTGKELTRFQGMRRPTTEPIVVKPGAK